MSEFRTVVEVDEFPTNISYDKKIMMMGSCFSEHMGNRLKRLCFPVDVNPFGILYNPESIRMALEMIVNEKKFMKEDLFFHQGKWNSFSHHGHFSSEDAEVALKMMNDRIQFATDQLAGSDFLFLTFGTAWIYQLVSSGKVVANCHKIQAKEFLRTRLSVSQIVNSYKGLLEKIWSVNPKINIIFSVSPIRHWKDGAVENQVSKSTLMLAINQLLDELKEFPVGYFPSYEIVMDDLRDYRFYEPDMLHPSQVAVNYIWEKFIQTFIEKKSFGVMGKIEKIVLGMEHRPFNEKSEKHQKFLSKLLVSCEKIKEIEPSLSRNIWFNNVIGNIIKKQIH